MLGAKARRSHRTPAIIVPSSVKCDVETGMVHGSFESTDGNKFGVSMRLIKLRKDPITNTQQVLDLNKEVMGEKRGLELVRRALRTTKNPLLVNYQMIASAHKSGVMDPRGRPKGSSSTANLVRGIPQAKRRRTSYSAPFVLVVLAESVSEEDLSMSTKECLERFDLRELTSLKCVWDHLQKHPASFSAPDWDRLDKRRAARLAGGGEEQGQEPEHAPEHVHVRLEEGVVDGGGGEEVQSDSDRTVPILTPRSEHGEDAPPRLPHNVPPLEQATKGEGLSLRRRAVTLPPPPPPPPPPPLLFPYHMPPSQDPFVVGVKRSRREEEEEEYGDAASTVSFLPAHHL